MHVCVSLSIHDHQVRVKQGQAGAGGSEAFLVEGQGRLALVRLSWDWSRAKEGSAAKAAGPGFSFVRSLAPSREVPWMAVGPSLDLHHVFSPPRFFFQLETS